MKRGDELVLDGEMMPSLGGFLSDEVDGVRAGKTKWTEGSSLITFAGISLIILNGLSIFLKSI